MRDSRQVWQADQAVRDPKFPDRPEWASRAIFANVHLLRIGECSPELLNRRLNEALICNEKQKRFQ